MSRDELLAEVERLHKEKEDAAGKSEQEAEKTKETIHRLKTKFAKLQFAKVEWRQEMDRLMRLNEGHQVRERELQDEVDHLTAQVEALHTRERELQQEVTQLIEQRETLQV